MHTAYIGILDNVGFSYISVNENTTPEKAYPLLTNHYNTIPKIEELLSYYHTSKQFKPMMNRLLTNEMRYSIKYFAINQKTQPEYVYVFNAKTQKWYCFDSQKQGFTSLTKLQRYI